MSLAKLLGSQPVATFLDQHYLKLPLAQTGGCTALCHLGTWATVERVLSRADADVLIVRGGVQQPIGQPSYAEARALHADGCTIVLRHLEQRDPAIAEFANGFRRDLLADLDVHIYCTPANQFGFGWHYDAEDVFILQTSGRKDYSLRKNTVHPWPLIDAMPADMGFEREIMPLIKCTLAAGDWLYIPSGYWHRAESCEDSISVAVGVVTSTALDMLDFVRAKLRDSLVWRQRLPVAGAAASVPAAEVESQYTSLCEQLGRDLQTVLSDPRTSRAFLAVRRQQFGLESIEPARPAVPLSPQPAAVSEVTEGLPPFLAALFSGQDGA